MKIKTIHMAHNYFPFSLKRSLRPTAFSLVFLIFASIIPPVFALEVDIAPVVIEAPASEQPAVPTVEDATPPPAPPTETAPVTQEDENTMLDKEKLVEEKPKDGEEPPQAAMAGNQESQSGSVISNSTIKQLVPEADLATGALAYTYPLAVPPGRNGLTPDVALSYNSQNNAEGSVVGYGWNVNIPSIERSNKTGTEKLYTDNYFTSSLSGELANVSGSNYRAKVESGDFLDYTLSSNAWTVKDKKGATYKFGTAAGSRQDNPSDSSKVYKWMLDEVRDANGNFIKYEYYKDGGQIYPDTITYTGNGSTDGPFTVVFSRQSRSDVSKSYHPAFLVTTNYRINEIQAKVSGTWVRKYVLAYTTGDNGYRSLLSSVTESGQKEDGSGSISKPAVSFQYQTATTGWTYDNTTYTPPVYFNAGYQQMADVNGDSWPDILESYYQNGYPNSIKNTWLNTGNGTWNYNSGYESPLYFQKWESRGGNNGDWDQGVRLVDVDGDQLPDLIESRGGTNGASSSYQNTGSGFSSRSPWTPTILFTSTDDINDYGTHAVDLNGDGLPDIIRNQGSSENEQINTGTDFGSSGTAWTAPTNLNYPQYRVVDLNGDRLPDILYYAITSGPTHIHHAYLNKGDGSWQQDDTWVSPMQFVDGPANADYGVRFADINGDQLVDAIIDPVNAGDDFGTYLNTGYGWVRASAWDLPIPNGELINGESKLIDINADGLVDFFGTNDSPQSFQGKAYVHNGVTPDLLKKVTLAEGGYTDVTYKASAQYKNGSTLLNANLPVNLQTVSTVTNNDAFGTTSVYTYTYEGGKYYFNTALDRKLAGFAKVTRTDSAGNKQVTYYHQGDSTNSSLGEYSDHASKIGRVYRTEYLDSSSNKYAVSINKWDKYNQATGRDFVKLVQTINFTYDGDGDHKDTATAYTYDDSTGNLTQKIDWGEVTGADAGTFTDTGTDKFTTDIEYAANGTAYIYLPKTETVTNQSSSKVREAKYYYDAQSHGTVNVGNQTKVENWKTSTTYTNTQKTYNTTYGLVTVDTNARGKATSYVYDSNYLYPATVTNALSQATSYTYDYSSGKVKQTTDVNSLVFQTVYDGLDRPVEEKQPDQTTPSTSVTKTVYAYTDTSGAVKVQKTAYLDGSTTVDSYIYFDGFARPIQTRQEMEDSNTFAVTDVVYNNVEQLHKESLPYASSGSSKTSATTTADLLTTYSYDALLRPTSVQNAVGTTSTVYDDWKTTVTDARSKPKSLYKDAYGQLVQVDELNSGSTYTTQYEYNGNGNLTKITDALGNIRNFTYDGLGRRLTAQDLHASADTTFGTWTYAYDDAANLTQTVDPESQTVNYTYDDVNRKLTEDYTGNTGTEVLYTYDTCIHGVGKLCESEVVGTTLSEYEYSPTGQLSEEYENTNSVGFTTVYTYDRQGNQLEVTNPDSSKVKYTYNTAGQQETIQRKESADGSYSNVVTDYDYGPHGKVIYQANQNGTATTNTYDATKLYRLSAKSTNLVGGTSAITFDATSVSSEQNNTSSVTLSHTTGSLTDGLIVVGLQFRNGSNSTFPSTSSCTYNGNSLTLAKAQNGDSGTGRYLRSELWYGVNPASGAHNVVCNFSSSVQMVIMGASTYSGVAQSNLVDVTAGNNNTSSDTPTVSLTTTVANALVVDSMESAFNTAVTAGSGQTQLWQGTPNSGTDRSGSSRKIPTSAGSTTMSWFNPDGADEWVTAVAAFKPASSGSGYGQQLAYTYDANGNITQIVDSSNTDSTKTVAYTYDDLNRLLTATTSSPASGQSNYTHTFTYDAIGNILTGPAGTYTYAGNTGSSYANPHAVTSITSSGSTSTITHDATSVSSEANNVSSITLSHTTGTLTNGLIVVGLQLRNGSNGTFPSTSSCTYNGNSLTQAKVQNGSSGTDRYIRSEEWYGVAPTAGAHNVVCNFSSSVQMVIMGASTYSGVDQTTPVDATASNSNTSSDTPTVSITTGVANALIVDSMEGVFNTSIAVGSGQTQLWQATPNSGTDHTGSSRKIPTSAGATTMSWFCPDGADEWASVAVSYKPATTFTTTNYTYDSSGNLTGDGTWTNTYDFRNKLTQSAKAGTTVSYGYDYAGQRVQLGNGTITTLYPTKFYNTDGTTPQKHVLDNQGNAVATVKGTGTVSVYYDHTDHLTGSNVITDSAGVLEELLDYYPYGDIRLDQKANSYSEQNKFTGYILDADTGLNYAGARYYNAVLGRFMSQDAVFLNVGGELVNEWLINPQLQNSYSYSQNNPLTYIDKDGNFPILAAAFIGAIIGSISSYFAQPSIANSPDVGGATYAGPSSTSMLLNGAMSTYVGGLTFGAGAVEYNAIQGYNRDLAKALVAGASSASSNNAKTVTSNVLANKAKGDAFEVSQGSLLSSKYSVVQPQITLQDNNGIKTRVDFVVRDLKGNFCLIECKSSSAAPLTKNQSLAFPQIERFGATVLGEGKLGIPGGTYIGPTKVNIIRPNK